MVGAIKKLVVDARPLCRGKGGIQRYLEETLAQVAAPERLQTVVYIDSLPSVWVEQNSALFDKVRIPFLARWQNIRFIRAVIKLTWKLQVMLWLVRDQPDVFWSPRHHLPLWLPKKCRAVVTVHDMVWRVLPETMPPLKRIAEKWLMPPALRRADAIIAVSDTTRDCINRYFPQLKASVTTIRHGVSLTVSSGDEIPKAPLSNYFLAVGTIEPRKNYERLIQAFELYVQRGGKMDLCIVGKRGWKTETVFALLESNATSQRIHIFSSVADQDLKGLYHHAQGFVMISLDEGFGLPALEAQYYGLPRLLSDIAVFRELFPAADLWASAENVEDIADKLGKLEGLDKPVEQADNVFPSWQTAADEIIDVLDPLP